jgi:Zn-dependent protease with chaperone function
MKSTSRAGVIALRQTSSPRRDLFVTGTRCACGRHPDRVGVISQFAGGAPMQTEYPAFADRSRRPDSRNRVIVVSPDAAEMPLRVVLMIIGTALWIAFVVSIIGLVYGIFFGLFFFFVHLSLIAHIRGSSIKLGPQQMPELYARVEEIAQRIGMKRMPDVYLQQSGGVLNAFATRFGRARFVVLFSDLVKACGDNVDALDFIIAHELGHIHRGHLNWR